MKTLLICLIFALILFLPKRLAAQEKMSLAGEWRIKLDPENIGTPEKWYAQKFADKIQLPGILQAQGYGDAPNLQTPWIGGSGVEKLKLPQYAKYSNYMKDGDYHRFQRSRKLVAHTSTLF